MWSGVPLVLTVIVGLAAVAFGVGRARARSLAAGRARVLHSLPHFHGWYLALIVLVPAFCLWLVLSIAQGPTIRAMVLTGLDERLQAAQVLPSDAAFDPRATRFYYAEVERAARDEALVLEREERVGVLGEEIDRTRLVEQIRDDAERYARWVFVGDALRLVLPLALAGLGFSWAARRLSADFRARNRVERWVVYVLLAAAAISILTTLGIVFSVAFETLRFFGRIPPADFLFGLHWSPQTAIRADQIGASGAFGAVPLFVGTMLISAIAMLVAGPIGLFSAIYLSEFASSRFRSWAKPLLEILAGVPTIVYGFFAAFTVAPFIRDLGDLVGLDVAAKSALAAGVVMGTMIIPFVSSLSDDAISAVPRSLRDASLGLGATRGETVMQVLVPAALPGIIAGFLLAVSRAIGETMIVVMAAGLAANLTVNPLDAVTTVTVQIVTLLTGDQAFDSAKTLSAFALGFVLFVATLLLNVLALYLMQKYREKYD
ncbi:MAG: phosphate ABC transporter permease subunit PstC [Alphaproteobacteria bacterium]